MANPLVRRLIGYIISVIGEFQPTSRVVVLQFWYDEPVLKVAGLQSTDEHLIGSVRHPMVGHLYGLHHHYIIEIGT